MDEIEVMIRKFGDDKSALLDQYERLSVEIQLNQAMLKRSLSEPTHQTRSQAALLIGQGLQAPPPQPPPLVSKKRGGSGFHKVLKKMIKPIIGRMGGGKKKKVPDVEVEPRFWKTFSRSLRV
ncbi:hypothetical protein RchiOBHm_Chr3g0460461 [Rosa chinensis]|uniref:Uncharacterized protein n=1 Tax=Rosa chinensis TaxID=74649 RepID=A0A2P6R8E3_ROSCH|nr:hypothetical protein RchiOBHm_Chr3g0460461 [Rosa chinensis]